MENENNYSILFIEDDIDIRQNYTNVLKKSFSNVYEAGNGLEAYELYLEKKPDIMIIDVDLPHMNGLDFLKKVRKNDLNTKAILLTSYSDKKTLLDASTLKLTDYLIKPVRRQDLNESLNNAIDELKNYKVISMRRFELNDNYYWSFLENEVYYVNKQINFTSKEKDLLALLFENAGNGKALTSYEEILYSLWDDYNEYTLSSLKTMMTNIRKKLPKNTIRNEYGIGYKIG
ncbi:response regulator transcription factor [Poseidonibacter lekithochrous]|uniref:response regulator transcription factor n=1 Tax=Poseidonibacter lekithochrous TaxID=1904463 RepID=UPI0008FCCB81|nr:response regulator transcription factor [Poseidonibacter lekithochrous]QKJ23841.1 two-component system response regulator [Poseidonibacter lekithochrous]